MSTLSYYEEAEANLEKTIQKLTEALQKAKEREDDITIGSILYIVEQYLNPAKEELQKLKEDEKFRMEMFRRTLLTEEEKEYHIKETIEQFREAVKE
jgi:hypothetical protein